MRLDNLVGVEPGPEEVPVHVGGEDKVAMEGGLAPAFEDAITVVGMGLKFSRWWV